MKTDSPSTNPPLLSLPVNETTQPCPSVTTVVLSTWSWIWVLFKGCLQHNTQCTSCNTIFFSTAVLLLPGGHTDGLAQRSDEWGQTDEVAVLSAPLGPRDVMPELARGRHRGRLPKVYHPHVGLAAVVVDKEKRAANHLIRSNIDNNISTKTSGLTLV